MAIWSKNEADTQIRTPIANMLCGANTTPSFKVVPIVTQLAALVADTTATKETVEMIDGTIVVLALQHPHHTVQRLAALLDGEKAGLSGQ